MDLVEPTPGFLSASWAPEESGQSDWRYVIEYQSIAGPRGLPLFKPPYRRITAIDLNTGDHLWWIPNGGTPRFVQEHPALQGLDIPPTGNINHSAMMVTPGMLLHTDKVARTCL